MTLWAAEWQSKNTLDGVQKHIICSGGYPILFKTRHKAREYIQQKYGYIKHRKDLRNQPHGWRLPKPIKIKIEKAM